MHACSVLSDSLQLHGLHPTSFLCPQSSPGKNTGGVAISPSRENSAWLTVNAPEMSLAAVTVAIIWLLSSESCLLLPALAVDFSCQKRKGFSLGHLYFRAAAGNLSFSSVRSRVFAGGAVVKNPPRGAADTRWVSPWLGG